MNAKSSALSLFSLSFGLVACEPVVDACEAAATHEAAVEFGVGENQLRLVEDGDLVTFHSGLQGGQHIYGGVLTQGMVPGHDPLLGGVQDGVELTFTLMVDDIEFGWGGRTDVALDGDAASSKTYGEMVYVEFWDLFDSMDEETAALYDDFDYYTDSLDATIEVDVVDSCGTSASVTRDIVLVSEEF